MSTGSIAFRASTPEDDPRLRALLESAGLPACDVATGPHQQYLLALDGERLVGSVGVELAGGGDGLYRSLAVVPDLRGRGLASALHDRVLALARERGLATLYLLTTTADRFAERRGFERIPRAEVPEPIGALAQFRALCPASAICMRRRV